MQNRLAELIRLLLPELPPAIPGPRCCDPAAHDAIAPIDDLLNRETRHATIHAALSYVNSIADPQAFNVSIKPASSFAMLRRYHEFQVGDDLTSANSYIRKSYEKLDSNNPRVGKQA
jgi:hypothetical protein